MQGPSPGEEKARIGRVEKSWEGNEKLDYELCRLRKEWRRGNGKQEKHGGCEE